MWPKSGTAIVITMSSVRTQPPCQCYRMETIVSSDVSLVAVYSEQFFCRLVQQKKTWFNCHNINFWNVQKNDHVARTLSLSLSHSHSLTHWLDYLLHTHSHMHTHLHKHTHLLKDTTTTTTAGYFKQQKLNKLVLTWFKRFFFCG